MTSSRVSRTHVPQVTNFPEKSYWFKQNYNCTPIIKNRWILMLSNEGTRDWWQGLFQGYGWEPEGDGGQTTRWNRSEGICYTFVRFSNWRKEELFSFLFNLGQINFSFSFFCEGGRPEQSAACWAWTAWRAADQGTSGPKNTDGDKGIEKDTDGDKDQDTDGDKDKQKENHKDSSFCADMMASLKSHRACWQVMLVNIFCYPKE